MNAVPRLTFLLPQALLLRVPEGRHCPCLHGVVLTNFHGLITIEGPSRQKIWDQVTRFFGVHAKGMPAFTRSAVLETPREGGRGYDKDSWTITINAGVSFSPCAIEPDVRAFPPELAAVS